MKRFFLAGLLTLSSASMALAAGYPWATNDLLSSADLNAAIKGSKAYNVLYATDTSADLTALNAAIATSDVTPVFLMPGHYQVCSPLTRMPPRGKIFGSDRNSEYFLGTPGTTQFPNTYLYCPTAGTFTTGQAFLYGNFYTEMSGFAVIGVGQTSNVDCVNMGNTQYADIRLFQAGFCRYGLNFASDGSAGIAGQPYPQGVNTQGFRTENVHIFKTQHGIHMDGINTGYVSDWYLGTGTRTESRGCISWGWRG